MINIQKEFEALKAKGAVMVKWGEKVSHGRATGRRALVIGVEKKLPLSQVAEKDLLPGEITVQFTLPTLIGRL